ncbi:MAG: hypothetical protein JXO72_09185, partial [Vicinamibacteria bacterium]|nr:hypothetical protein [Vicinamibacteria bacterium]
MPEREPNRGRKRMYALVGLVAAVLCMASDRLDGYPKLVEDARDLGARNCTYCHTRPRGSSGWNKRGQHLIREKT